MYVEHPFEDLSHNLVKATGPVQCELLFVGESPGHEEDEQGSCFVGRTGREFDKFYLPSALLRRHEVRVTNLIPVHPILNRNPTADEIKFFEHILLEEIERCKPRIIVPMGSFAVKYFLGGHRDVSIVHGLPYKSDKFPGVMILPCYHPAAGLHNNDTQPLIVYDFQQIRLAYEGTLPDRPGDLYPDPIYTELTTAREVWQSLQGTRSQYIGMDTEGYAGSSWGLSYCVDEGISYVIRAANKEALVALDAWLAANPQVTVILHNALHDLPILREMGVRVGAFVDTMVLSYCLCLEPQGLKDLAYRHAGMRMKSYEDVTAPAMRKLITSYLIKVASGDWGLDPLVPEMESAQVIKYRQPQALHKRAMRAVNDILGFYTGTVIGSKRGGSARLKELGVHVGKVDHAAAEGLPKEFNAWFCEVPIPTQPKLEELYGEYIFELKPPEVPTEPPDAIKRWKSMSDDLEESVERCEAVLGALPEVGLDALEDQQVAINYSARDADATLRVHKSLLSRVEANGMGKLAALDMSVLPFLDRMRTVGIKVNREHMLNYGEQLKHEMRALQEKLQADLGVWINPSSSHQVGMVIYEMLGFPVEVRTETGQPSTNDKVLEALAPLHKSITDITDFRELHKLRSTYAMKLPRWTDEFNRVHPRYKYTRVASGRLALSDPNLLGIPTRSQRGKMIRAGFVPEHGRVFISCDLSQIEVRVAAHYSKDPNLIKIFMTGQDFHDLTTSFMWKISVEEVKADNKLLGGASKRSSAKNVSFGVLYGISAKGLQAQLKSKCHTDWTEEQCQEMIDLWLETAYPQVKWYMERQKFQCRQLGYVESMHGRRRYLPGANSTIKRIQEEAYRAAINHPIQSTAAEILKIAEYNVYSKVLPKYRKRGIFVECILAIHDEIVLESDESVAEQVKAEVIYEMENAVKLCVPVVSEGKISKPGQLGGSWADLK